MTAPYRDETDGLRARLEEATRAQAVAGARVGELEAELALVTGPRSWRGRVLGFVIVAIVSGGLGALAIQLGRSADRSALENRLLSMQDAELGIRRTRDERACTLHFHRRAITEYGHEQAMCETRVRCEGTLYDGLTSCADHQHLRDGAGVESDGDGIVDIDLLAGTATVDGEQFRF